MKLVRLSNILLCSLLVGGATLSLGGVASVGASHAWCVEWEVLQLASLLVTLPLMLDVFSFSFLAAVLAIALAVIVFSSTYMYTEPSFVRFHLLVMGFVTSMLLLIVCPNLVSLLLGWDGLGVTSYLLVVYFQNPKAGGAGMITVLTNRVGDVLILISIASLAWWGSWLFWSTTLCGGEWGVSLFLLTIAACTKSAQLPFSAWLPAAMAAPTPVSSLVHSSTLVTAGVYLLFRLGPSLLHSGLLGFVFGAGVATMLMASVSALYETDMKKIVALSTLSQLGLMFTALGLGGFKIAFFHLLTHAFFKALLFMSVGNLIHLSSDYQDLRKIGVCTASIPVSLSFSLAANMSLMGLPFMAGFYSKDLMLETMSSMAFPAITWLVYYTAVALTAIYSARFIYLVTWSSPQLSPASVSEDNDPLMSYSGFTLWPLACAGGALLVPVLFPSPEMMTMPVEVKNLTFGLIISGVGLACAAPNIGNTLREGGWSWGSLWGLPYASSFFVKPALGQGISLRLGDLSWGKTILLSTAAPLTINPEHPPSVTRSYAFLALTAGALLAGACLYLCVMNLIISFKLKTQCANTYPQTEAGPCPGAN